MPTQSPRLSLTLDPRWKDELDAIKREKFLNGSKADVLRYLIQKGLRQERLEKAQ